MIHTDKLIHYFNFITCLNRSCTLLRPLQRGDLDSPSLQFGSFVGHQIQIKVYQMFLACAAASV
jgi:hypothetical protein